MSCLVVTCGWNGSNPGLGEVKSSSSTNFKVLGTFNTNSHTQTSIALICAKRGDTMKYKAWGDAFGLTILTLG